MWRYMISEGTKEVFNSDFEFYDQHGAQDAARRYRDKHDPANEKGWHATTEDETGKVHD
jgi:hypothetical protein